MHNDHKTTIFYLIEGNMPRMIWTWKSIFEYSWRLP